MGITKTQNEEMNISAFLNQYVYKDDQSLDYDNKSIYEIVEMSAELRKDRTFMNALEKHPEWGNIVLKSQSSIEGKIPMTELIACTFEDPSTGNVYVSYRGTGDGKWVDNGVAMANESSLMQRRAEEYFNSVIEDSANGYMNYQDGKIIVTGHSKGGNSAQYVTLSSEYGHLIDNCYSMNGQGFSQAAIDEFIEKYGDKYYHDQIDKMYSICGHNDYVHDLGNTVIKKENTYLFNSTAGDGFGPWHQNEGFFNENGEIPFAHDEETGEIISVEQGPIGVLASQISENMMALNEEDIEDCAVTIMSFLEIAMGTGNQNSPIGTGDVAWATPEEFIGFIANGIPLIIQTAATSEEAQMLIFEFLNGAIESVLEKENGEITMAAIITGVVLIAPLAVTLGFEVWLINASVEFLVDVSEKIKEFSKELYEYCISMVNALEQFAKKVDKWFNSNFNAGYKYATANPTIFVDTYKLRNYATRLNSVNRRVTNLDRSLNSLYYSVCDLEDLLSTADALWNLMQADVLTSYSLRLALCKNYLEATAEDFEKTEKNIVNKVI